MFLAVKPADIPERLRQHGRNQSELARYLRLDPSSLTKTIKGKRKLTADELQQIEQFFLGVEPAAVDRGPVRRRGQGLRIPVYGYAAAGGDDRIAYADDRVLDFLDPPPFWNGSGDLVYVRVVGESMEPRIFSGEVVPVRLNLPPGRGDDCLIEFTDGTAVVKTYQHRRDGRVFAHQYNPDKGVDFDAMHVAALHTVWRPKLQS